LKLRECFEAADWGYVIEASILNPLLDHRFPERGRAVFKLDTGFNGPTMVTNDIFELLRLSDIEVPDDMRPSYATLAGTLTMRSAPALLEVAGKQIETDILTTLSGPSRMLVGFQVLKRLNLALLENRACVLDVPPKETAHGNHMQRTRRSKAYE
jgi:predicted aspartyl protease